METRKEKAVRLFKEGYNCSQAVFAAYSDLYDVDEDTALRIAGSFGAGMGRMREICGAVSGMFMVAGLEKGSTDAKDTAAKKDNYDLVVKMAEEFKKKNNGTIVCGELLGLKKDSDKKSKKIDTTPSPRTDEYYKKRPCVELVADCADIIDEYIIKHSKKIKKIVKLVKVETSEHVTRVAELADEIWREYYDGLLSEEQIEYMVDKYQSDNAITKQMVNEGYEYYLINKEGTIIGFVAVLRNESDKKLAVSNSYLLDYYREKGYSRLVIECVEAICKEAGYTSVELTVNKLNKEIINSYYKYGFTKVKEVVTDIGNGYSMNDYMMKKNIQ